MSVNFTAIRKMDRVTLLAFVTEYGKRNGYDALEDVFEGESMEYIIAKLEMLEDKFNIGPRMEGNTEEPLV